MSQTAAGDRYFQTERVWKILLRIAPPVMLAQLIQALYNIVDSYFGAVLQQRPDGPVGDLSGPADHHCHRGGHRRGREYLYGPDVRLWENAGG